MPRSPRNRSAQMTGPIRIRRSRHSQDGPQGSAQQENVRAAPDVTAMVQQARQAADSGQREYALQLARQATQLDPNSIEAWLYRASLATTADERLAGLSNVLKLAPTHPTARTVMYQTLKRYLDQEPFLRYIEENDVLYRVLLGEGRAVVVPKDRTPVEPYPPPQPTPLQPVNRWLVISVLGLLLAGLVTVVTAPYTVILASRATGQALNVSQRRRAWMAVLYAFVLWGLGLVFSFLFVLHLLYL